MSCNNLLQKSLNMTKSIVKIQTKLSVGIIGCGWLGKPLAKNLIAQGCSVMGTSSQRDNVEVLVGEGIPARQLSLPATSETLNNHDVFNHQILVIAITPQFKRARTDYAEKIEQIVAAAKHCGKTQRIILLNSSAIYNGLLGEVDENSRLDLTAAKVEILQQAEKIALGYSDNSVTLRLAGLVGPNRHPGTFIKRRQERGTVLADGDAKVNLIHQQDAIGLILALMNNTNAYGVFNGVCAIHPSKKDYYGVAAKALSLPAPVFNVSEEPAVTRIVTDNRSAIELGYQYVYPDLIAWL